jgi:hypothetical protein
MHNRIVLHYYPLRDEYQDACHYNSPANESNQKNKNGEVEALEQNDSNTTQNISKYQRTIVDVPLVELPKF